MSDEERLHAHARDITRRLLHASLDEVRVLDRLLLRLEQRRETPAGPRFEWRCRIATGPRDIDHRYHCGRAEGGSFVTLCNGRWELADADVAIDLGSVFESLACPRCWSRKSLVAVARPVEDELIDQLARAIREHDLESADLRAAAAFEQAELARWQAHDRATAPYDAIEVDLGGEA